MHSGHGCTQGVDDVDVAAMGYAQLHGGVSPTSAMQVEGDRCPPAQCPKPLLARSNLVGLSSVSCLQLWHSGVANKCLSP